MARRSTAVWGTEASASRHGARANLQARLGVRLARAAAAAAAVAAVVAGAVGAVAVAAPSATLAAPCQESAPDGRLYTVTVCVTSPADGATVTSAVPVSATVSVDGSSPGVRRVTFFLDGEYLLTDYEAPYEFTIPSDKFVDGAKTIEAEAWMRDTYITAKAATSVVFQNGVTSPPANTKSFTPSAGSDPGSGSLVVAATGDGAGGDREAGDVTDLIAGWNPNLVLYLGDVYAKGTPTEFHNWYGQSSFFGRFRAITNPTIGNHEYSDRAATGYFDYWDNVPHYYSVDTHGWHLISLDTNSTFNQLGPGTAQYEWLANDLATSSADCTLVYYHHPLFNIGEEGSTTALAPIWSLLAEHGVELVLNGHDHTYQRWQPLDGDGNLDPSGVTQIVVGTGGHALGRLVSSDSRLAASASAFGALRLDLNSGGATYQFVTTQGQTQDSGSVACSRSGVDTRSPRAPSELTATATYKTNIDLTWAASSDNVGVTGYQIYRDGALLTTIGPELAYSDSTVAAGRSYTYSVRALDAAGNVSGASDSATATTPRVGALFHDGFETGATSKWTHASGITVQQTQAFAGSFAARAATTGAAGAWAWKQLGHPETNLYYVTRFKVLEQAPATNINLLRFRNNAPGANAIATLFVSSTDKIGLRNDVTGVSRTSSSIARRGVWHTLQAHVVVNGTSSQTEVWLDGALVAALSQTNVDLGPIPIGRVELGDPGFAKTYDIVYDEVAYDRELVGDLLAPSAPTGLTGVPHSGLRVDLTWTAASDDVGVTGYDVYRDDTLIGSVTGGSSYVDTAVSPRSSYTYKVRATDGAGNVSGFSTPTTVFTGDVLKDDFESGDLAAWTSTSGLDVQQDTVNAGQWAARAASRGRAGASAQVRLGVDARELYYRIRFFVTRHDADAVTLFAFRSAANDPIASAVLAPDGELTYRNHISGDSVSSGESVEGNTWHELEMHVRVDGPGSKAELWLDGRRVVTETQDLGRSPIGRLELGDPSAGGSFDIAFDDVLADTTFIPLEFAAPEAEAPPVSSPGAEPPAAAAVAATSTPASNATTTPAATAVQTQTVVLPDTLAPHVPSVLRARAVSESQIELVWNNATDDVGVVGYRIYRDGALVPITTVSGATTSYTDEQLESLTSHTYTITAVDAAGNVSPFSNEATATTPLFGDGFEAGDLGRWTTVLGLAPQKQEAYAGDWGAQARSARNTRAFAVKQLPHTYASVDYRLRLKILSGETGPVNVLELRTRSGGRLFGLRYGPRRRLGAINGVTGAVTTSSRALAGGRWYALRVQLVVDGAASRVDVWLDGTKVRSLSKAGSFGRNGIGQVVAGEMRRGHRYSYAIDDVVVRTELVDAGAARLRAPD